MRRTAVVVDVDVVVIVVEVSSTGGALVGEGLDGGAAMAAVRFCEFFFPRGSRAEQSALDWMGACPRACPLVYFSVVQGGNLV